MSPENMLVVLDEAEAEDGKLRTACVALFGHIKNVDPLTEWLKVSGMVNQKNLAALLRTTLHIKVTASITQATMVMDVMRYLFRHGAAGTFPHEVGLCKGHFDKALTKSLLSYKGHGMSSKDWWEKHSGIASLVMPADAVNVCINHSGADWTGVEAELAAVVQSSQTGANMFGLAWTRVSASKASRAIRDCVLELHGKVITEAALEVNFKEFGRQIAKLGKDPAETFSRKKVEVFYRGTSVTVSVVSLNDEYLTNVAALAKSVGVETRMLGELFCEGQLCKGGCPPNTSVSAEVVKDAAKARHACSSFAVDSEPTANDIKGIFEGKSAFLHTLDRQWKLEESFFLSCVGESGDERFKQEILGCLPDKAGSITMETAMQKLRSLAGSKLFSFVGIGQQGVLTSVQAFLSAMSSGRSPKIDADSKTAFLTEVKRRLGQFLCLEVQTGSSGAPQKLSAGDAVKHIFDEIVRKGGEGADITYEDIMPLEIYGWFLSKPQQADVLKWKQMVFKKHGSAAKTNDAVDADEPRPAKKISTKNDPKTFVAGLFK